MTIEIIGIIGLQGSGKDYVSNKLSALLFNPEKPVITLKMARYIKNILEKDLSYSRDYFESRLKELKTSHKYSPRIIMQKIGALFRDIDPDFFINQVEKEIALNKKINPNTVIIINDIRFENEVLWIKKKGGLIINVNNPDLYKFQKTLFSISPIIGRIILSKMMHISESTYFDIQKYSDITILNDLKKPEKTNQQIINVSEKIKYLEEKNVHT